MLRIQGAASSIDPNGWFGTGIGLFGERFSLLRRDGGRQSTRIENRREGNTPFDRRRVASDEVLETLVAQRPRSDLRPNRPGLEGA